MTDKIQMTKEQARFKNVKDFCDFCFIVFGIMPKPEEIETAQLSGYILKSELQRKVEEAEDYYRIFRQKDYNMEQEYAFMREALISCYESLQLLKQSHPEFKK